jgi:hypothetical protein
LNADPDPDPATQINADPCGSGYGSGYRSETLELISDQMFLPGTFFEGLLTIVVNRLGSIQCLTLWKFLKYFQYFFYLLIEM